MNKNQSKIIMETIKDNYVLIRLVKYWLNFTEVENENQFLTNI